MKSRKIIATLILGSLIALSGCADTESPEYQDGIRDFNVENTAKVNSNTADDNNSSTVHKDNTQNYDTPELNIGLLEIIGDDKSTDFEVSGNDIIYNGVKYIGLNSAIKSIEIPYEKTTFTNFIVKTFNPSSSIVRVTYTNENDKNAPQASFSIDEEMKHNWEGYESVKESYEEPVVWTINIEEATANQGRLAVLTGCKRYIIQNNMSKTLSIDMSKYYTETGEKNDKAESSSAESSSAESSSAESRVESLTTTVSESALACEQVSE